MPRIYGTPSAKAAAVIKSRSDFTTALRDNNQKMLLGLTNDEEMSLDLLGGYMNIMSGVPTHRFAGYSSYLEAGTKKVWASACAVDMVANVVVSTDMSLAPRDKDAKKRRSKVKADPELLRLLANPNPYDTISEMLYLLVCHLKFTGNAFWFLDEQNALGQPKAIYWLNPRLMEAIPDAKLKVSGWRYRVNGTEIRFTPDEIIHFKRPHANNPIWGLGDIERGESLYEDFINMSLYRTRFVANGGVPNGVLVNETYSGDQDEWDKTKAKFQENFGGVQNAGKVAWLNGKWSMLQMGITSVHMQELEKSQSNVKDIFINHGVPLSVAGFGSANYATARQEEINFRKYTCRPLVELIVDALNSPHGLIHLFHQDLELTFLLTGLIDMEQVGKDCQWLIDSGAMNLNQARVQAGLEPTNNPLHEVYFIKNDRVPIEMAGLADVPPVTPPPVGQTKPKPAQSAD